MDVQLLTTVLVIFVATLVGSALQSQRKDRCLQDMHRFHVTVAHKDKRLIWGTMNLQSTGFELVYRRDMLSHEAHAKTSYVFYKDEYNNLQAIYRYVDELTDENRQRRDRDLERAFHPSPIQFSVRAIRNFLDTATDSLTQAFNLILGRSKIVTNQALLSQGQAHLTGLTKDILGYVGTNYDPLLERFVGTQVVVETTQGNEMYEHVGILKDYSATFLEILDVYFSQTARLDVQDVTDPEITPPLAHYGYNADPTVLESIQAVLDHRVLIIRNQTPRPILITAICSPASRIEIHAIVEVGRTLRYALEDISPKERIVVELQLVRRVDMVLPRAHSLLRHRAERYTPAHAFGVPLLLQSSSSAQRREEAERERLSLDPSDAEAAVSLGLLLLQRNEIQEADHWLSRALEMREKLADGGLLATQELERTRQMREETGAD